ncbi:MAG: M23 family metallopeptidase, partial [Pseudomonadota bacterium]
MGLKRTFVFFSGLFLFACATSVHAPLPIKTPTYTAQIETAIKGRFQNNLSLCPGIRISNAPDATPDGAIAAYPAHVKVRGLALAVAPVEKGCLSSGFGPRQLKGQPMRPHRGLDIAWAWPTDVYAAAAGTVVNVFYTASYGKTLVLDHGAGVY